MHQVKRVRDIIQQYRLAHAILTELEGDDDAT